VVCPIVDDDEDELDVVCPMVLEELELLLVV
jgi:hypothetical protein